MKLLYAEDEAAMSEAVADILRYHKYSVDCVCDGADALDYARSGHYDGIILDVMMPRMSGFEVLRQLRQEGLRTPVLLLTARSEVEDRIQGLDLGADDYLPKPFAMGELLARVRAMLRRREEFHAKPAPLRGSDAEPADGGAALRRKVPDPAQAGIPADGAADAQPGHLSVHGGYPGEGLGL